MKKLIDFAHKFSSALSAVAALASAVPALAPWQHVLIEVAGLLGGPAVVGSIVTKSSAPAASNDFGGL